MTSLKTSIKTITYLSDTGCLEIQGASLTFYGYLVALKTDAETEKLVADINAERKASYQQLAKQNNVSVDDIAKLAGQKLVARAKPGEYVQGINGKWVRKF
ncbi:YdbL family protein [Escherichia coli]|uniref:YdbL family protein n=1 Tax=Escherichia coli TaxID=562 RepID=UPI00201A8768|nr:YdbL family protein [Escherichia coli]